MIPIDKHEAATVEQLHTVNVDDTVAYVFTGKGFKQFWIPSTVIANDREAGRMVVRNNATQTNDWFIYGDGQDSLAIIATNPTDCFACGGNPADCDCGGEGSDPS